jgi:hypothetical protein
MNRSSLPAFSRRSGFNTLIATLRLYIRRSSAKYTVANDPAPIWRLRM